MMPRTTTRWLTVGFWVAYLAVVTSYSWVIGLLSLLVMIVLDQYQEEG